MKLSPEKEEELCEDYRDGWKVQELTIIYRVSTRTVYRILARNNVPRQQSRKRRKKPKPKPKKLQPCGTNAAYQRHRLKGEYPCTPCLEAHAADVKKAKDKRDQSRASDLARGQRRKVRDLSA